MPSNIIRINNFDDLSWQVGDSKMDDLIVYLNEIGFRIEDEVPDEQDSD